MVRPEGYSFAMVRFKEQAPVPKVLYELRKGVDIGGASCTVADGRKANGQVMAWRRAVAKKAMEEQKAQRALANEPQG